MGRLPVLSGADAVRIFGKADWTEDFEALAKD
jgi:hypothetical protein